MYTSNKYPRILDVTDAYLWHYRLDHINNDYESLSICESCLLGKMTKSPFTRKSERASDVLSLVHTDVCGLISTSARGGYYYFITFTDDLSRYGYIYLIKLKSESFEIFK